MKKNYSNYEAPKAEWVELFAENGIMTQMGSMTDEPGTQWS